MAVSRRKSGWLMIGGGVAYGASAFRPWVSDYGFQLTLGILSFAAVLILGMVSLHMGARVLSRKMTPFSMVLMWLLSAVEIVVVISLHLSAVDAVNNFGFFGESTTLGSGFYLALSGLTAVVLGTVMMQATMIVKD